MDPIIDRMWLQERDVCARIPVRDESLDLLSRETLSPRAEIDSRAK